MKSFVYIAAVLFYVYGCADLERCNPVDPKNPDSSREKIVLIESFVNQSGGSVIAEALAGLDQLMREYNSHNFIYLEHHVAKTPSTDPLALETSLARYLTFVPQATQQGLPDVFFNGSAARVQGASTASLAYQRYREQLEGQLSEKSFFTIEATARMLQDQVVLSSRIARLGRHDASDVIVYDILAETLQAKHPVVRAIVPVKTFDTIQCGEIKSMSTMIALNVEWQKSQLVAYIVIQDNQTFEVLASTRVDIDTQANGLSQ
jgi:hypothetical protein